MSEMKINRFFVLAFFMAFMGCAAPVVTETYRKYGLGKGGTDAAQSLQPIGVEEEKTIGGSLAIQVFDRYGGLYDNPELQRYITLVGQSLADVSDRPELDYHFAVVNSEHPNAFATPGGYVFVSVGLLRTLENEAQLAGVLGHEIAHITHRHALETLERNKKVAGFGALSVSMLGQSPDVFDKVIEQAAEIIFTYGLDKNLEYEADKMAAEYANRLGYNSGGLKSFLDILNKTQPGKDSVFLSTHPSPQDRLAELSGGASDNSKSLFAAEFKQATRGKL
ncbi:MAG: peptidase M48 [Nitrospinaceae bacterium]|nr:MAG: peptidase M48 [Nitrospinaceae bacterium]